jgi:hypothetical protein
VPDTASSKPPVKPDDRSLPKKPEIPPAGNKQVALAPKQQSKKPPPQLNKNDGSEQVSEKSPPTIDHQPSSSQQERSPKPKPLAAPGKPHPPKERPQKKTVSSQDVRPPPVKPKTEPKPPIERKTTAPESHAPESIDSPSDNRLRTGAPAHFAPKIPLDKLVPDGVRIGAEFGSKKENAVAKPPAPPKSKEESPVMQEHPTKQPHNEKPPDKPATAPDEVKQTKAKADMRSVRGVEHDRSKVLNVYYLGGGLVALALFSMIPGIRDVIDHFRVLESNGVARWAFFVLFVGTVQLAYAFYLVQLPDWSSVWVVAIFSLLLSAAYALLLAITMLGGSDSQIVEFLQLAHLAEKGPREVFSRATMWCFVMLSTTSLFTYFSGRVGTKWHHQFVTTTVAAAK